MSTDKKLSKAQASKIFQYGGFLGSLLSKLAGPLMKVVGRLATNIFVQLGIKTAALVIDARIQKKIHGFRTTTSVLWNEERNDLIKIIQVLVDSNISEEGVTKKNRRLKIKRNDKKKKKKAFLEMLLRTLGASLLGNMLAGRVSKASYGNKEGKLIVNHPNPLKYFERKKYYQNEPRFNRVNFGDNLPEKIKDGGSVINLDKYTDVGTRWIVLFCRNIEVIYFDSLGVKHAPKEIKKFIGPKNIKTNIFRIQSNNSIMYGHFYIGLIDSMVAGKTLIYCNSLFSFYDFEKMTI